MSIEDVKIDAAPPKTITLTVPACERCGVREGHKFQFSPSTPVTERICVQCWRRTPPQPCGCPKLLPFLNTNSAGIDKILAEVDVSRFPLPVRLYRACQGFGLSALQVGCFVPLRDNPEVYAEISFSRYVYPSVNVDAKELARSVREWIIDLLAHEVDENVLVKGERVIDPHGPNKLPQPFLNP